MKPEQKARGKIDRLLRKAHWEVVDRRGYTSKYPCAVEEFPLNGGRADYYLFVDGRAVGVLEAKKEGEKLLKDGDSASKEKRADSQAVDYAHSLPEYCASWWNVQPLVYLCDGEKLLFKNLAKGGDFREIGGMHTPFEALRLAGAEGKSYFGGLPRLDKKGFRDCQFEAVQKLEESFKSGKTRALIEMATGAGKTFTACAAAYRILSHTPAKRVLFLVDRANLAGQAEGEFGSFKLTDTGEPFSSVFTVQRAKSNKLDKGANVVISTIQRLYSILSGREVPDDEDEARGWDDDEADKGGGVPLPENPLLPKDYFDLVVVDECHRSIYGRWGKVLGYFSSARFAGLTATPYAETFAFFDNNSVAKYGVERSVADGVNVPVRPYSIKTRAGVEGGTVEKGERYFEKSRFTGATRGERAEEPFKYDPGQLNRDVVNPEQIRTVLRAFKDAVYTKLYPNREADFAYIPKTLVFAANDDHAQRIVEILRSDVFPEQGKNPNFAQKITYSAGGGDELIRRFRNDRDFRIAVTVTLVATGTDIKPLEILLFMRNMGTQQFYEQMKGRGMRTVDPYALRNVTPNADGKDCCWLVDAAGVLERERPYARPQPGEKTEPSLEELLEKISHGYLPDPYLYSLHGRLGSAGAKAKPAQKREFEDSAKISMEGLSAKIASALESGRLPPFVSASEENAERRELVGALAENPRARGVLLEVSAGYVKTLDPGSDKLVYSGFSKDDALQTAEGFEKYLEAKRDEIEALRIIYRNTGEPVTVPLLEDLRDKLSGESAAFAPDAVWNAYNTICPGKVKPLGANAKRALTNLIQLARFAYSGRKTALEPLVPRAAQRFNLWSGQKQRALTPVQRGIALKIAEYVAANGAVGERELMEMDTRTFYARAVAAFGGAQKLAAEMRTLSEFFLAAA